MAKDKHAGNVLLLRVACLSLLIGLVLAWFLTMNKMKLPFIVATFKDSEALLSSHLDFLMMAMLLFGIYASKIPLPKYVQWPMAIGSIGNPTLFLIGSIAPEMKSPVMLAFTMISISLTTFGYAMASIKLIRHTLDRGSRGSSQLQPSPTT